MDDNKYTDEEFKKEFRLYRMWDLYELDGSRLTDEQLKSVFAFHKHKRLINYVKLMAKVREKVNNDYVEEEVEHWDSPIPREEEQKLSDLFWDEGKDMYFISSSEGEIVPFIHAHIDKRLAETREKAQKMIDEHQKSKSGVPVEDKE